MRHLFELEIFDLEVVNFNFEDELTQEETTQVLGGIDPHPSQTGGGCLPANPTTLAIGEEGGGFPTTLAIGEEGGGFF